MFSSLASQHPRAPCLCLRALSPPILGKAETNFPRQTSRENGSKATCFPLIILQQAPLRAFNRQCLPSEVFLSTAWNRVGSLKNRIAESTRPMSFLFPNRLDLLSEWLNTWFKASSSIPNRETLGRRLNPWRYVPKDVPSSPTPAFLSLFLQCTALVQPLIETLLLCGGQSEG
jgi:hypothetical protein